MITSKWKRLKIGILSLGLALYLCFLSLQAHMVFGAPSAVPDISIGDASTTEGDSGESTLTFTITRTGPLTTTSEVSVQSIDSTAEAGSDFKVVSETVTFANGDATETVDVIISGDETVELNEEFFLALTNVVSGTVIDSLGVGKIENDDQAEISISANASGNEDDGPIEFAVEIDNPVDTAVTVGLSITDGSATFSEDYGTNVASVTFPANSIATQTATVAINSDLKTEADETFNVALSTVSASGRDVITSTGTVNGTILNDDLIDLVVTQAATASENSSHLYSAKLNSPVDGAVEISYQTASKTAGSGADFTGSSGTLNFSGLTTEVLTFTIDILSDARVEPNETFNVDFEVDSADISGLDTDDLATEQITTTIVSTDTTTIELVGNATVTEGDSGSANLSFTVLLGPSSVKDGVSVPITVSNGTATIGDDFGLPSTLLIEFDGNSSTDSETFTIPILGDDVVELDETFTVEFGTPIIDPDIDSNLIILEGVPHTVTIEDDDTATIKLTADSSKSESSLSYPFSLELDNEVDIDGGFSVSYATQSGTATSGVDYTPDTDSVTFVGAENEIEIIPIDLISDSVVEADETFSLNLLSVQDGSNTDLSDRISFSTEVFTGTINNDDDAEIRLSFFDGSTELTYDEIDNVVKVEEGNSGTKSYEVIATLIGSVQGGFSIDYALNNDTAIAGSDYQAASGTLNFAPSSIVQRFDIVVNGDQAEEQNETFILNLSNISNTPVSSSDITVIDNPATFEITNDDGTIINVSVDPNEALEGSGDVTFTIELDSPSVQTVSVDYEAIGDTATVGSDFAATSGSVTFQPGETIKDVTVSLIDSSVSEPNETFFLQLSNASNATIGINDKAELIIIDDDGLPTVSIASEAYTVAEAGGTLPISVTLSRISSLPISVRVTSTAGEASSPADYVEVNEIVVFDPGTKEQTVQITIEDDSVFEKEQSFSIALSDYVNSEASESEATTSRITIEDNDPAPTLSIADVSLEETNGTSQMQFTVRLNRAAEVDIFVSYETQDGTATANSDYVPTAGRLEIPAGDLTGIIVVTINGDDLGERDETFNLILSAPSDGGLDPVTNTLVATGTLENDDFFQVSLPIIINGRVNAPDLVPVSIAVNGQNVSITIQNRGPAAVSRQFWVDLFVDPTILPTMPNHTTETLNEPGLVWLINRNMLPINPGETVTISLDDSSYRPELATFSGNIPAGTLLVAHVDSADALTDFGAIEETHEINSGIYNNILNSTTAAGILIQ